MMMKVLAEFSLVVCHLQKRKWMEIGGLSNYFVDAKEEYLAVINNLKFIHLLHVISSIGFLFP
jgi:hypothetical protein